MSIFFDTNVIVYAQQRSAKGEIARKLLAAGGMVSVQALNEFASVSRKKFGLPWSEITEAVNDVIAVTETPIVLSLDMHEMARSLAEEHKLSFYDALILAAALQAGCTTLMSEDMQDGRCFGTLTVRNPF